MPPKKLTSKDLGEFVWVKFKGAQHPANLIQTSAERINEMGVRLVEVLWSGWTGPKSREWVPASDIEPDNTNSKVTRRRRTPQEAVKEEEEVKFGRRHCEEEEPANKKRKYGVKTRSSDGSAAAAAAAASTAHLAFSIKLPVASVARKPRIARKSAPGTGGGKRVNDDINENSNNSTQASHLSQGLAGMPRKNVNDSNETRASHPQKNVNDGNNGAHHEDRGDCARRFAKKKMLARKTCGGPSPTTATTTVSDDCPCCQKEGIMKRQRRPNLGDSLIVRTSHHADDKKFAIVTIVGESCLFQLRRHSHHRCCDYYPRLLQVQYKTPNGAIRTEYIPEHFVTPAQPVYATTIATRKDHFAMPKAGLKEDDGNRDDDEAKASPAIDHDQATGLPPPPSSSLQETIINKTNVVYRDLVHAAAAKKEPIKLQDIVDQVHEDLGLDETNLSFRTIANCVVELLQQKKSPPPPPPLNAAAVATNVV